MGTAAERRNASGQVNWKRISVRIFIATHRKKKSEKSKEVFLKEKKKSVQGIKFSSVPLLVVQALLAGDCWDTEGR